MTNPTKTQNDDVDAVRACLDAISAATRQQDADALSELFADDCTFVVGGGNVLNKEQRLDTIRTGNVRLNPTTRDEETIRLYADTAISVARLAVSGVVFGKESNNLMRVTTVLAKKENRWQLAAQQVAAIT